MKKIRKYGIILFAGLCACAAWSCEEDKTDRKFTPKDPVIKLGGDVEVGKAGGSYTVPHRVEPAVAGQVRKRTGFCSARWRTAWGDGEFTFTVSPNKTLFEREGRVTAWITDEYAQSIRVVQAPSSPEDLEVHWYVKTDGSADNDGMTWETATTLHNALSKSINGNFIHVAAGTYVPEQSLAGSKGAAEDATFEISANVSLIGGYPADAVTGAVADPDANPTVLSGRLSGGRHAYHVVLRHGGQGRRRAGADEGADHYRGPLFGDGFVLYAQRGAFLHLARRRRHGRQCGGRYRGLQDHAEQIRQGLRRHLHRGRGRRVADGHRNLGKRMQQRQRRRPAQRSFGRPYGSLHRAGQLRVGCLRRRLYFQQQRPVLYVHLQQYALRQPYEWEQELPPRRGPFTAASIRRPCW